MAKARLFLIGLFLFQAGSLFAQQRFIHSVSGTSSSQGAIWATKDLGLFEKYGLNVDLVLIPGGARGMQALLGGSVQSADSDGVGPINAVLRGGDAVIVAGLSNKHLFKFVVRKEIREPRNLLGKKIGVANFGGSNEFAVLMALKKWNVPRDGVTVVAAGSSALRLAAMEKGGLDATELPYDQALAGARMGLKILADMPSLITAFPDKVITVRRSFLEKDRDTVKRFLEALCEGIFQFNTNKERAVAILARHLHQMDPKVLEETYNIYGRVFPLPPRVEREGMRDILDQIQRSGQKADFNLDRFLDQSVIDDLEKEGFFKRFSRKD